MTTEPAHAYLSTACFHEQHGYCSSPMGRAAGGWTWPKSPASCKFCGAPCACPCHREPEEAT